MSVTIMAKAMKIYQLKAFKTSAQNYKNGEYRFYLPYTEPHKD